MRIALIAPGFSSGEEDWCIPAVLNLVRELAQRHEVSVFALRYPHRRDVYHVYGARVFSFGGASARGLARLPLLALALARIAAQGRAGAFDVIHALWADEPGFLATAAGRLVGAPALVSLMGGELARLPEIGYGGQLSRTGRVLIRSALARAGRVTVGSEYLWRLAEHHVSSMRLSRMPLGVDTRLFFPELELAGAGPLSAGRVKLLHVASLAPVKDQATLLRALALAVKREPGLHLHIVGEGPLAPQLRLLAQRLGLTQHLTFHGAVAHDRLPDYYCAADLCVLSSRYESQSMVVLEAAACACPSVGTAVGLLPELAPAVRSVAVGDAPALSEALVRASESRQALGAAGQQGLELVRRCYALERTVDRLERLYAQLAGHLLC